MMDLEPRPDGPKPEPVTARSLGMFNVIFGVLLILAVSYEAGMVLALPALGGVMDWAQEMQQEQRDEMHAALMQRFDQRLQAATSDEERARIEAERVVAELNEIEPPDLSAFGMGFLDDPRIRAGALAKFGVMAVLYGLLVASGVGLVRLRRWGRTTARVAALLLIPAGIGFTIASVRAAPLIAERWAAQMGAMLELEEGPVAEAPPDAGEAAAALEQYAAGFGRLFATSAGVMSGIVLIYPVVVLVVASRPGVRSALGRRASPA